MLNSHSFFPRPFQTWHEYWLQEQHNVSAPKNKENAPAGESGNQRPKRKKEKVIRLDDLIPKRDVTGGHQLLFGATDTTIQTNPKGN